MDMLKAIWGSAVKELVGIAIVLGLFVVLTLVAKIVARARSRGATPGSATSGGAARSLAQNAERSEAMFRSMFPDLQPYFHPSRLVEFVRARRLRRSRPGTSHWASPPGLAVANAEITVEGTNERVRLLDAAGVALAEFLFEEHEEGGVLRVGKGKFTVNTRDAVPRVRYWHPDREFKWSANKGWTFQTRMADEPFSSDRDSSSSSSSSSWTDSSSARTAAAGAAIVGAGGAFDGGGASGGWDGAESTGRADSGSSSDGADSGSSAGAAASATSY